MALAIALIFLLSATPLLAPVRTSGSQTQCFGGEQMATAQASFLPLSCASPMAYAHSPQHNNMIVSHGNSFGSSIITAVLGAVWDSFLW